ncbi:MAG TPA: TetR/AcrR family transcriptional regulator [Thermoanaerobaculia bacterium]|nr:TetR/AcrR family transcriptional regulator [Thermoanaerobaculia bacterium]
MKGDRTRQSILDRAVSLASTDGLEGLTIGRLAEDLEMSKSGLFAHFGSKEELQLATIEEAKERFVDEVFRPVLKIDRGYPRLLALCRSWIDYLRREVFPGGCFFAAASFEFDGRSGPVRDSIGAAMTEWIGALEKAINMAKDEGHLDASVDAAQVAFELNSLFFGANFASQLWRDPYALDRAQKAVEARLEALRIKPSRTRSGAGRKIA